MNNRPKTQTLIGEEARNALFEGVKKVHDPVAATIGAKGRNAVFEDWEVTVTNDGVSIARKINPADPFERLGADLIKQAAERTNEEAGDGTTTTIIVGKALVEEGNKMIAAGVDPMTIRNLLNQAKDEAIAILKTMSRPVDNLFDVANISVENEVIAKIVSDAVKKAGVNGNVIVEESNGYDIEKEERQGYFWPRGYTSPYMVTNPDKMETVLIDPVVIVTDRILNLNKELMGPLTEAHQAGKNYVLIVADKVEGELLQTLIANKMKGLLISVVVRRPGSIEELEDIATITNATAITADKGIKNIAYSHFGSAKRVVIKRDETIIVGNDETNPKMSILISSLQKECSEKEGVKELSRTRLAKLTNGVVVIRVGAKTEAERKYLRLKIDDAVGACKSAMEEDVVEGGGISLALLAEQVTYPMLKLALMAPYFKILANAGIARKDTLIRYNVLTGEPVKDMFKAGIIDPTKVERVAIENAVSFASNYLTIESATVDIEEDKKV